MSNTLTNFPLVQYSGMDYDTVIKDIQTIIQNHPKWLDKWGNFYEADAGTILTELMAYLADNISTRLDYAINENFISTASQDKNKLKILKLINYSPTLAIASSLVVKVDVENTSGLDDNKIIFTAERTSSDSISERAGKIMKITGTDIYGNAITFEAIPYNKGTDKYEYFSEFSIDTSSATASYSLDNNNTLITLQQGETKQTSFYSDETDAVTFTIEDTNVIKDSIRIFDRTSMEELLHVKSFVQKEALSENYSIPYTTSLNEDSTLSINFANKLILSSTTRRYTSGSTIDVFYRIGGGEIGNIPINFMNKAISVPLENGGSVYATVYNETKGTGGADAETASEAVLNGPLSIRTAEKAVTPEDYDTILNNYGDILKVKTYSTSNVPTTFKEKYGRHLNPQENFSFIIMNKEHSSVPASKYNYFPWIELEKENRFNEKYTFSTSSFNSTIGTPTLGNKLTLFQSSSTPALYTNCMTIDLSSYIKDYLFTVDSSGNSIPNTDLIVKIMKNSSDAYYFNNIPFSLTYDSSDPNYSEVTSKQDYLGATDATKVIEVKTNSKYLSSKWTTKGTAIDIYSYGKIGLVLDDKGILSLDLLANVSNTEKALGKVYRYLTNTPTAVPSGYVWTGSASEAIYRSGIIETLNSQISANSEVIGSLYNDVTSIQYVGAGKDSIYSTIPSFEALIANPASFEVMMVININGSNYRFIFSDDRYTLAKTEFITNATQLANATPTNIVGISAMINYELTHGVSKYENSTWNSTLTILSTDIGFKYDFVKRYTPSGATSEYDYTASIDMMFYTKSTSGFKSSTEKYIDITYTKIGNLTSLMHNLANVSEITYANVSDFAPSVITAASYDNIVSVKEATETDISGSSVTGQFIQFKSPLVGDSSSIYFVRVTSNKDFMSSFYGLNYIDDTGSISSDYSITSGKAIGIKRATLLIEDQSVGYLDGVAITPYSAGTIIYENNCINTSLDFGSDLYYTYKTDSNTEIELGSVYENFYYTGDSTSDENYKTSVSGLLGMAIKTTENNNGTTTESIDTDKSDYVIKFSTVEQDTSSIYCINSDTTEAEVSAIPVDRVSLQTTEIGNLSASVGIATNLIFAVDDMKTPITLSNINTATSSSIILESLQAIISDRPTYDSEVRTYSNFANDLIRYDYETRKILHFGNVEKSDAGCVKFYKDTASTDNANKLLYRALFGTNITNPDFYDLYAVDISSSNRYYEGGSTTEYSFWPSDSSSFISFIYKTKIDGIVRYGDYYINKVTTYVDSLPTNKFYLTKTSNSTFQDKPFYVNFVNDRYFAKNSDGTAYSTEEEVIQNYLDTYTVSGVENTFAIPYFLTFDIKATIYYNSSYSKTEIKSSIDSKLSTNYGIENRSIGSGLKRSSLYKDIMTVSGVTGVSMTYFGLDSTDSTTNETDEIIIDFDEILVIHEDVYETGGSQTRGAIFTYEKDGN